MKIGYTIELTDGRRINGTRDIGAGECRIIETLPEGRIKKISAEAKLYIEPDELIFMNGYQTWTYCPERTRKDAQRAIGVLPKLAIKYYGVDRYGDYHFVDYPNRAGISHGESYCYFRRGDTLRLIASLDETPGYTLFRYDCGASVLTIERDCAGVNCGGEMHVFDLFYAQGTEDEVFDAWFGAMNIHPRTTARLTGYSSWYNRYQKISEKSIRDDLIGCAAVMQAGDLFQIDDGWEPAVGDWLETDKKKFPNGLKGLVDEIHEKGFKAGLWLAPFVAQRSSRLVKEHPDWLLKVDGKPWYNGCNWGGFYSLDLDNPAVVDYMERVFDRVLNEWGFDLVKLDFLYGIAPFGNERESRAARMTRAIQLLRRVCGDKLILGCGVPLMPGFGVFDYCRISCDVGLDWNNSFVMQQANRERVSTKQAIGNSIFRRQLSGRAWLNDPDVFFLREDNLRLTEKEKYILATVNSLFGGMLLCSDNMAEYSAEALSQYRQLLKNRDAKNVRVHFDGKTLAVSYETDGIEEYLEIAR